MSGDSQFDLKAFYKEAMSVESTPEEESEFYHNLVSIEDRFSDIKLYAQGGLKEIYSCVDKHLQKQVALAKYKNAEDSKTVDSFIHEAYITSSLEHPNIVPVYDVGIHEHQPFFTMKLLKGKTLKEILESARITDRDRLFEIFLKVCDAIAYAHSKNIIHLDLKPLNIQVDQFGDVVVYDWGIARKLNEDEPYRHKIEGSPGFMAPEQITGDQEQISTASDIYSLGVILYNTVTFKQAFTGDTETVVTQQLSGEFVYPSKTATQLVDPSIESVILKAMELEPGKRYQNVEQLAADVRAYVGGYATNAQNAGYSTLLKLLVKRNKKLFLVTSLVLAFIVSQTAFFMKSLNEKRLEAELALSDLKKSEEARDIVTQESAHHIIKFADKAYEEQNYKKVFKYVKNALELAPERRAVREFELRVLFGQMKFRECLKKAELYENVQSDRYKHASLKAIDLLKDHEYLSAQQLCDLIDERPMKSGLEWQLVHTVCYTYPLEIRIDFARERIKRRSIRDFRFELKGENDYLSLTIGGKGFSYLNCLANLPIQVLDITDTGVRDLSCLKNMPLRKLNVSGTIINDLKVFHKLPLELLNIRGTQIKNLSSMNKSALRELTINDHCESLEFLKECSELKTLRFPKRKYTREYIDSLKLTARTRGY